MKNIILEDNYFKCRLNNIGLYSIYCHFPVNKTINKLESILMKNNMTIFNSIDHAAGAKKVDIMMQPTEVIIFGNPNVGSLLMADNPTIAIDLPQKILVTQNRNNKEESIIYFNDPFYIAKRHNISDKKDVLVHLRSILLSLVLSLFKIKTRIL
ncbi:DUF302 domain-containing protein [Photobacterium toruni]|uniref:DUF302 domain-containing protein n=1 Tax=Photobacterium toruni TaxID=1935446 RepID=UPI002110223A|nr:DUF302 domain-containing protein [Photobacterium toruni]